tara:strand:+ start:1608 stop:1931 length:324 start_codon:yes stop_codon:yes gene_type:complete
MGKNVMADPLILENIEEEALDQILSLHPEAKTLYFTKLAKKFYPNIEESSERFKDILESYISSFYLEKLYRSNRFFNEKFIIVYTQTGLIRNVWSDLYYTDDDLITH